MRCKKNVGGVTKSGEFLSDKSCWGVFVEGIPSRYTRDPRYRYKRMEKFPGIPGTSEWRSFGKIWV